MGDDNEFGGVYKMGLLEIIIGSVIILLAVVLVACVLLQSGKEKGLSGTISGAAETFFSKGKSKTRDKMFARITTVIGFAFVILVVTLYIIMA